MARAPALPRQKGLMEPSHVPGVRLATEFVRTPFRIRAMGYTVVISPVSSLRVANRAHEKLYAALLSRDVLAD
jgi:2-methylisocitrate lyase-like PEP mutase family enzyme